MPILVTERKTKKVALAGIEGGEAEIYESMLAEDMEKVLATSVNGRPPFLGPLLVVLKDWNLTNDKGEKLPINLETVGKLPAKTVTELYAQTEIVNDFLAQMPEPSGTK